MMCPESISRCDLPGWEGKHGVELQVIPADPGKESLRREDAAEAESSISLASVGIILPDITRVDQDPQVRPFPR